MVSYHGLFQDTGRPWLVLGDDRHPFHGEEFFDAGITPSEREGAVGPTADAWSVGGLPQTSYASLWFVTTLKHPCIDRGVGAFTDAVVRTIVVPTAASHGLAEAT